MSKAEILEYFSDINVVYNNCGIYDSLLNMLTEFEQEIRAKTIDEFASELENHSIYADIGEGDEVKLEWVSPVTRIKEVAEQMKVGAK